MERGGSESLAERGSDASVVIVLLGAIERAAELLGVRMLRSARSLVSRSAGTRWGDARTSLRAGR